MTDVDIISCPWQIMHILLPPKTNPHGLNPQKASYFRDFSECQQKVNIVSKALNKAEKQNEPSSSKSLQAQNESGKSSHLQIQNISDLQTQNLPTLDQPTSSSQT
jgi:hypothetical protein